jgi:hypothetical protein
MIPHLFHVLRLSREVGLIDQAPSHLVDDLGQRHTAKPGESTRRTCDPPQDCHVRRYRPAHVWAADL